jgi:hypothetical protein
MSRGLGKSSQRAIWEIIMHRGKPVTFAEMCAGANLGASLESSFRRALHKMVKDGGLIAIGNGGPSDPFRYFIHPLIISMMGDTLKARALWQAFEARSGQQG